MLSQITVPLIIALIGLVLVVIASDRSFWSYVGAMLALVGFLTIPVGYAMGYFVATIPS